MAIIVGTNSDDTLRGTMENDWISGFAGQDDLNGREGDDFLDGGAGDDVLTSTSGYDLMEGERVTTGWFLSGRTAHSLVARGSIRSSLTCPARTAQFSSMERTATASSVTLAGR
ncbi:hypothetical protein HED52_15860 [Ochrobactrum ciceri]|uniref:Uncharacterized protein n=1 Tax=Brucella ciceri TaxID=391287 RepID=A0ABX1DUX9_9HYPH|nr:hypothetical protein [Brucella ciceri]